MNRLELGVNQSDVHKRGKINVSVKERLQIAQGCHHLVGWWGNKGGLREGTS